MKTILFLITVLVFGFSTMAMAQPPPVADVALSGFIANGTKVFNTAHTSFDNTIPTDGGDLAHRGYLLEDLDAPLDTSLSVTLKIVDATSVFTNWTTPIREYAVILDYQDNRAPVLTGAPPTFTDLSGLGICSVTNLAVNYWFVESCQGTSNGTGELLRADHTTNLSALVNDGRSQVLIILAEAVDDGTGGDLLNGTGCTPPGICVVLFGSSLQFTLTHYGRNPAVYGYGNGPKMKADSATMQEFLEITCNPEAEIICMDHTGGVSCRQPHICNTWGDANGDNLIGPADLTILGASVLFNVPLDIGPDDNKFSPYDPSPFSP